MIEPSLLAALALASCAEQRSEQSFAPQSCPTETVYVSVEPPIDIAPRRCTIEAAVASLGPLKRDCGRLGIRATPEEHRAAILCVRDAIDKREPFAVAWGRSGTDSVLETALVAQRKKDHLTFYEIHYDGCPSGCGDHHPYVGTMSCRDLIDVEKTCANPDKANIPNAVDCKTFARSTRDSLGLVFVCDGARQYEQCQKAPE